MSHAPVVLHGHNSRGIMIYTASQPHEETKLPPYGGNRRVVLVSQPLLSCELKSYILQTPPPPRPFTLPALINYAGGDGYFINCIVYLGPLHFKFFYLFYKQ